MPFSSDRILEASLPRTFPLHWWSPQEDAARLAVDAAAEEVSRKEKAEEDARRRREQEDAERDAKEMAELKSSDSEVLTPWL